MKVEALAQEIKKRTVREHWKQWIVGVTISDSTIESHRQEDFSKLTAESKDSVERKLAQLLAKMDRVESNLPDKN